MGYSAAGSALYGHRLADVFILYHKRTFETTEKRLNKGICKGFRGHQGWVRGYPQPYERASRRGADYPPIFTVKIKYCKTLWNVV